MQWFVLSLCRNAVCGKDLERGIPVCVRVFARKE